MTQQPIPIERDFAAFSVRDGRLAPVTCVVCGCRLEQRADDTWWHFAGRATATRVAVSWPAPSRTTEGSPQPSAEQPEDRVPRSTAAETARRSEPKGSAAHGARSAGARGEVARRAARPGDRRTGGRARPRPGRNRAPSDDRLAPRQGRRSATPATGAHGRGARSGRPRDARSAPSASISSSPTWPRRSSASDGCVNGSARRARPAGAVVESVAVGGRCARAAGIRIAAARRDCSTGFGFVPVADCASDRGASAGPCSSACAVLYRLLDQLDDPRLDTGRGCRDPPPAARGDLDPVAHGADQIDVADSTRFAAPCAVFDQSLFVVTPRCTARSIAP